MNDDDLPKGTVRDISLVVVAIFEIAVDRARRALDHLRPFVEPPEDIQVVGNNGIIFSGIVVIERGAVVAGVLVEVGRVSSGSSVREPIITPPSRFDDRGRFERDPARDGRLPHWSEDPRDLYSEDEPWRRR